VSQAAETMLAEYGALLLVTARLVGLFLFAPLIGSAAIPLMFRALLVFAFGVAVFDALPPEVRVPPPTDLPGLAWMMVAEVFVGLAIGLIATLPLLAMQMAGGIISYQMGLSIAQTYNPEMGGSTDAIGQLMFLLGVFAFIAVGGPDEVFIITCESFEAVPQGGVSVGHDLMPIFMAVLNSGTELAMRVAMPAVGSIAVMLVAIGFIMRSVPQINIMTVGFSLKILAGIATLALSAAAIGNVAAEEVHAVLRELGIVLGGL